MFHPKNIFFYKKKYKIHQSPPLSQEIKTKTYIKNIDPNDIYIAELIMSNIIHYDDFFIIILNYERLNNYPNYIKYEIINYRSSISDLILSENKHYREKKYIINYYYSYLSNSIKLLSKNNILLYNCKNIDSTLCIYKNNIPLINLLSINSCILSSSNKSTIIKLIKLLIQTYSVYFSLELKLLLFFILQKNKEKHSTLLYTSTKLILNNHIISLESIYKNSFNSLVKQKYIDYFNQIHTKYNNLSIESLYLIILSQEFILKCNSYILIIIILFNKIPLFDFINSDDVDSYLTDEFFFLV
jgi:hypothetical protein